MAEAARAVEWVQALQFFDLAFADLSAALASLAALADGAV